MLCGGTLDPSFQSMFLHGLCVGILQAAQGSGTVSKPGGTDPAFFIYGDYERVAVDISVLVPMLHDTQYAVPVLRSQVERVF